MIVLREDEIFDLKDEEGFVIFDNSKTIGLLTFRISHVRYEILSLDSKIENQGIGTSLIDKAYDLYASNQCILGSYAYHL